VKTVALSANTSWYLYNFRASTIRCLVDEGYHVTCLAPEDDYSDRLNSIPGCAWLPLPIDNQGNNPLADALLCLRFLRYYRQLSPVVACHFTIKNNVYGSWAAHLLGIPCISNIPGLGTSFGHSGLVPWVARALYRTSQRYASTVFCQNRADYSEILESGIATTSQLELLPGSGVDTVRFSPAPVTPATSREFRFLFAGRMLRDKGLPELREAVDTLAARGLEFKLWLSGFSDAKSASAMTERQSRDWARHPNVEWLGPTDEIEAIYREVDCLVLPSYYREGTPKSLLEAGAMGLPAITTNLPGCGDVISDGDNGIICAPRNAASLADAMARMLQLAPQERRAMGYRGRERVISEYDERIVVAATITAITRAIAAKAA